MSKGKPNKHQAATVAVVDLGSRLGYRGRCRCSWRSAFVRATREAATKDTNTHIQENK